MASTVASQFFLTPRPPFTSEEAHRCGLGTPQAIELRLQDAKVYVNPEAFIVRDAGAVILGFPNYIWDESEGLPREVNPFLGVRVDRNGIVTPVPLPIDAPLAGPAAVPLGDGSWLTVFARTDVGESHQRREVWSGRWNGEAWTDLSRVPIPDGYSLGRLSPRRLQLSRSSEELWLAVVVEPRQQLLLFQYQAGSWVLWADQAALRDAAPEHVDWLSSPGHTTRRPVFAYVHGDLAEGRAGTVLTVGTLTGEGIDEVDLHRWGQSLTMSGLSILQRADTLLALVAEDIPQVYVWTAGGGTEAIQLPWSRGRYDARLVDVAGAPPVVLSQSRNLGGRRRPLVFTQLIGPDSIASSSYVSKVDVLQGAAIFGGQLWVTGLSSAPVSSKQTFYTKLLRLPVLCGR